MVSFGGGLRRLSATASVAGRLPVPGLWRRQCLDDGEGPAPMRNLSAADIVDRGNDYRGHAETVANLVRGDVVRDQPEERRKCAGPATHPGLG